MFLFFGVVFFPVLPHFQLDVVLTQDQLKDDALRESTLETLDKASGNQSLFWIVGGIAQIVIGAIGLKTTPTRERKDEAEGRRTSNSR